MAPKKAPIYLKLFIFLLITVGIVYIVLQIIFQPSPRISEGFQTPLCPMQVINNRNTYLCDNSNRALALSVDSNIGLNDSICYNDSDSLTSVQTGGVYYICYDRPAPLYFNEKIGATTRLAAYDDMAPESAIDSGNANCSAYNGPYKDLYKTYTGTSTLISIVDAQGLSNIEANMNLLSNMSNTHCARPPTDPAMINVCRSINVGIQAFSMIYNSDEPNSLKNVSRNMNNAKNIMSNQYYNFIRPAFYNSGCMSDSDVASYDDLVKI